MKHFDDCAGIGGFALAAQMAGGIETCWAREIDEYARAVYRSHFPHVRLYVDARGRLPESLVGQVDLYTAGFPCQPVSQAGKRQGSADPRWLWPWIIRTIGTLKPKWVLLENVAGMGDETAVAIADDLAQRNYGVAGEVVDAQWFLPQRRRRWFFVGLLGSPCPGSLFPQPPCEGRHLRPPCVAEQKSAPVLTGRGSLRYDDNSLLIVQGITEGRLRGPGAAVTQTGKTKPMYTLCGRPHGVAFAASQPTRDGEADGLPRGLDTAQTQCLGNAIVPQVAAEIMRAIVREAGIENTQGCLGP